MQRFVKILKALGCSSFFLVLLSTSLACFKQTGVPEASNSRLVVALGSEPTTLDPRFATDTNGMRIVSLMFHSLVRIGPELKVEGDAAKTWTFDAATKTFVFSLYPRLRFSNGRELEKEDLIFSFEQYRSERSPFRSSLESIKNFQVEGSNEEGFKVNIVLAHYSSKFLISDLPMLRLLPKTEIETAPESFSLHPIGTGPFGFEKKDSNQIILKAQKAHAIVSPKVSYLVFQIIRDDFTRFQKTLKGSVDIAQVEIAPSKVAEFEKQPESFQVYKYPGLSMSYILINLKDPDLAKYKLRRAIAEALNRPEIVKYKLEGLGLPATSLLTPKNPYFHPKLKDVDYDLDSAKAAIEALGLKGKSFSLKTSNAQSAVDNGRVLTYQISKAGLNIQLQSFEWGTFYSDIRSGNFQLATLRWTGTLDPDIYRLAFHSKETPPGRNRGAYSNPLLDRLTEEGLKISDDKKRIEHYFKVQEIIQEDLAIIPLWYDEQVSIVHRRVEGYKPWQTSDFYPFIYVSKK